MITPLMKKIVLLLCQCNIANLNEFIYKLAVQVSSPHVVEALTTLVIMYCFLY
jgi:hypothetical protein